MEKFTEFRITETNTAIQLYVELEDGTVHYVRDYDYLYEGDDLQFYSDANGTFVEVYCYGGVSYRIDDGKLLEYVQDTNGIGDEWEITLSMLLAHSS